MRKLFLLVIAVLTAGLVVTGCSSSSGTTTGEVKRVGVDEFAKVVDTAGTVVVDVRTPAEFATGHLKGAVNIDVESSAFGGEIATLDKSKTYAVYCRSGNRSVSASKQMAELGIASVYDLDGGILAWEAAGKPVVR